jgi:hypothetical protein
MLTCSSGPAQLVGIAVKNYTIIRIGHEYIVQADAKSVLKVASRRRAARLVSDAAELLEAQPIPQIPPPEPAAPSIDRDVRRMADPSEVS